MSSIQLTQHIPTHIYSVIAYKMRLRMYNCCDSVICKLVLVIVLVIETARFAVNNCENDTMKEATQQKAIRTRHTCRHAA
jgi:hypothetical protein